MYEDPIVIQTIADYIQKQNDAFDNLIYEAVQKVGIYVNREELIKALEYDRDQYRKGYMDGKRSGIDWRPYSEVEPGETGKYLIQTDANVIREARWTDCNPFKQDLKTKPHWNIHDVPQYSYVVAWAEMPQLYHGEGTKEVEEYEDSD